MNTQRRPPAKMCAACAAWLPPAECLVERRTSAGSRVAVPAFGGRSTALGTDLPCPYMSDLHMHAHDPAQHAPLLLSSPSTERSGAVLGRQPLALPGPGGAVEHLCVRHHGGGESGGQGQGRAGAGGMRFWRAAGSEQAKNLDSGGKSASCWRSWPALPAACPLASCDPLLLCNPFLEILPPPPSPPPLEPYHPFPPLTGRGMASRRPQAPPCRPAPTLEACMRQWARARPTCKALESSAAVT